MGIKLGNYELNQKQVKQILSTEPTKIKESDVFNDLKLTHDERIEHARKILNSRKVK